MPELVDESVQLVAANARLARLNVVAGAVGGVIGAGLLAIRRPAITLALAASLFSAAIVASRVPTRSTEEDPPAAVVYEELHGPTIVATAWAFTVDAGVGRVLRVRPGVRPPAGERAGLDVRGGGRPLYGAGTFLGNVIAPVMRRRYGRTA